MALRRPLGRRLARPSGRLFLNTFLRKNPFRVHLTCCCAICVLGSAESRYLLGVLEIAVMPVIEASPSFKHKSDRPIFSRIRTNVISWEEKKKKKPRETSRGACGLSSDGAAVSGVLAPELRVRAGLRGSVRLPGDAPARQRERRQPHCQSAAGGAGPAWEVSCSTIQNILGRTAGIV